MAAQSGGLFLHPPVEEHPLLSVFFGDGFYLLVNALLSKRERGGELPDSPEIH